jgi:hypothetical protein
MNMRLIVEHIDKAFNQLQVIKDLVFLVNVLDDWKQ